MFTNGFIEIIEVGPRDGLQNEPKLISTEQKKNLINQLAQAGIKRFETASFVNPKLVPQMADSEEIVSYCNELGIQYIALTPNVRAIEKAVCLEVPEIAVFVGASNTFNKKNINRTTKEALDECKKVFKIARKNSQKIRGYISMAFQCPYQGSISFEEVLEVCRNFVNHDLDEIVIGDTSGFANQKEVYEVMAKLRDLYPNTNFVGHFHDTKKRALINIVYSLQAGITKFDSSIGGLGGCPFSPGALGNVATEEVIQMLHKMEYETFIDEKRIVEISKFAKSLSTRFR